jgi:chloramphenicol 3-O-phosphotransferase
VSRSSSPGQIVILNGAPRSGKSSIAAAIQATFPGVWVNIGVDVARAMTPPALQPGVGLRPDEPDHPVAAAVPALYAALWESIAAHSRLGLNVVVDVGLYDVEIATDAARRLAELPVLFVGVRCDVETSSSGDAPRAWMCMRSGNTVSRFRSLYCFGNAKSTPTGLTTLTWTLRPRLRSNAPSQSGTD